jgi:hypothetical protein
MEDLKQLNLTTLVDMLARQTNDYLRMLKEGTTELEYKNCKERIAQLMTEIESRRRDNIISNPSKSAIDLKNNKPKRS